jgi:hypothetical protein
MLERDARGGTRYIEIIKSQFGVVSVLSTKNTLAARIGFKMKSMAKWIIRNGSSRNGKITSIGNKRRRALLRPRQVLKPMIGMLNLTVKHLFMKLYIMLLMLMV